VTSPEEIWMPLVDEPIGRIVGQIEEQNPDIRELVRSAHRVLAFRTFAYIRVGILLGKLLVEADLPPDDGTETWVEQLLAEPRHRAAVEREVRAVAEEIAAEAAAADDEHFGPDESVRERFREFTRNLS
jgi:hypothetical protein